MGNGALLQRKTQQVIEKFPRLRRTFDLVADFGALGFEHFIDDFNDADIRKHVESV